MARRSKEEKKAPEEKAPDKMAPEEKAPEEKAPDKKKSAGRRQGRVMVECCPNQHVSYDGVFHVPGSAPFSCDVKDAEAMIVTGQVRVVSE